MQGYPNLINIIEDELRKHPFSGVPNNLYEPLNYIIGLGGKRIRPVLALLGCQLFSGHCDKAIPSALAVEVFHNFSLIHDDIMDKSPIRRGKPTVHEKWDTPTAILSGDLMLVKAYELLLKSDNLYWPLLLQVFNRTAAQVCEGQQMDMNFETQEEVTKDDYLEMIRLKTSVLLGCSLQMGAIVGGASEHDFNQIYAFGTNMGLGFQLMDDYLDVFGTSELVGKQRGGDILSGKKTILAIHALAYNDQYAILQKSDLSDEERVEVAKSIFIESQADVYLKDLASEYFKLASKNLDDIDIEEPKKEGLRQLFGFVKDRAF